MKKERGNTFTGWIGLVLGIAICISFTPGQAMSEANCAEQGTIFADNVQESQVKQVEGIGAYNITNGQVGFFNYSYGAYAGEKFRQ